MPNLRRRGFSRRLSASAACSICTAALALLAGCGGGGSSGTESADASPASSSGLQAAGASGVPGASTASPAPGTPPGLPSAGPVATGPTNSPAAAARFLTQATFGPTAADIAQLSSQPFSAWIEAQFSMPQSLHRSTLNQAAADLAASGGTVSPSNFFDSYWSQAIGSDDQLRQRAAFALSQVFVISFSDTLLRNQPRGVASYYDLLGANAFGNFRDLLEGVALHPMMGVYLSHLKNQKEDPVTGRVPDLNFAREVTQLFTIGQYQLNADGTNVTNNGAPVMAYNAADLAGLSQVFTGWSWYAGPLTTDRTNRRFFGNDAHVERDWRPMQDYSHFTGNTDFHSISPKSFLGVTIGAQTLATVDTAGDLKIALDTLFNHPNVGPFIGRQLIQRLVTSNPSRRMWAAWPRRSTTTAPASAAT